MTPLEKILTLQQSLKNAHADLKNLKRALDRLTIIEIGQRGELVATKRELNGVRAAADKAVNAEGPLGCSGCDAPAIDELRQALDRKIW